MYYELYIDILFLINFMMDYLLLLLTRKILKCTATHRNILYGSLLGSVLTCVIISLPVQHPFLKIIFIHIAVSILMITIGLRIKKKREFIKAVIALHIGAVLMGGIFTYFHQYLKAGSLFFALAVLSYCIVQGIWSFLVCINRINSYHCRVTLFLKTKYCITDAIIDTGNSLTDPVTGNPVCIADEEVIENFKEYVDLESLREIEFRSIGNENGKIKVFQADRICVENEKEYWIEAPVIAVSRQKISSGGECHMILNPDILDME